MPNGDTNRTPGPEHVLLGGFVGSWRTSGEVLTPEAHSAPFRARDTYEWLDGRFFLLHRWDAEMPDGVTKGIEVIGYDPSRRTYFMQSYDSRGNVGSMQASVTGATWTFWAEGVRFAGGFRDEGMTFAGVWERRAEDGSGWSQWMKIRLTREGPPPGGPTGDPRRI